MLVKTLPVGQIEANCYIVTNENTLECVVIDPGDESNTILDYLESNKLKCQAILLTHGHFDHTGAALTVSGETGAPIYINEKDCSPKGRYELMRFSLPENGRYLSSTSPSERYRPFSGREKRISSYRPLGEQSFSLI